MNSEQKAELGLMVEQLSQSFQDSYDSDLDLLTRRDKAHVTRIAELEATVTRLTQELEAAHESLHRFGAEAACETRLRRRCRVRG